MNCSICGGAGQIADDNLEGAVRWCPECEGFGSIAEMLRDPPEVNPQAKVVRKIKSLGLQPIDVMDDGTYRVYYPQDGISIPGESGIKHFAHGRIRDKTDEEISQAASHLLSGSGVRYFHEDGTRHHSTEKRVMDKKDLVEEVFQAISQIPSPLDRPKAEMAVEVFFNALQRGVDKHPAGLIVKDEGLVVKSLAEFMETQK